MSKYKNKYNLTEGGAITTGGGAIGSAIGGSIGGAITTEGGKKSGKKSGKKGGKKSTQAIDIVLTKTQREILHIVADRPDVTIEKVAEILSINTSAVQKHFDKLKEKVAIERVGADKGGYWKVLIKS